MELLSKNEAYELPDGTALLEVNKNKKTGIIKTISVTVSQKYGQPVLFGIWPNWNNNDWLLLGYQKI